LKLTAALDLLDPDYAKLDSALAVQDRELLLCFQLVAQATQPGARYSHVKRVR
jgi:hypothetical protein